VFGGALNFGSEDYRLIPTIAIRRELESLKIKLVTKKKLVLETN
jgi:hypothetical protein